MEAWKIKIFLFPFCINNLDDANFAKKMVLMIESVRKEEEFFSLLKSENILELLEKHLSNKTSNDIQYMLRIASKSKVHVENIEIFFSAINFEKAAIVMDNNYNWVNQEIMISTIKDITKVKNYYLGFSSDFNELKYKIPSTYKNLIFLPNCFNRIKELGNFTKALLVELQRHLFTLNSASLQICSSMNKDAEIKLLLPRMHVSSRGQTEPKEKFIFDYNGGKVDCRWHSKMFHSGTDQRIYFSCDQNQIIVARIGDHPE